MLKLLLAIFFTISICVSVCIADDALTIDVAAAQAKLDAKTAARKATTLQAAATRPIVAIPSIEGVWQEAPGVLVTISQSDGKWTAKCEYANGDKDDIKWEINSGTITADGKLKAKLHHTQAPAGWEMWQDREASLSKDGKTISGTASWKGGGDKFTWTKTNPTEAAKDTESKSTTTTTYDRFKDVTTLETPKLILKPNDGSGVTDLWMTADATFAGKTVAGKSSEYYLTLYYLTPTPLSGYGELILIVDGTRMKLTTTHGDGFAIGSLDKEKIGTIAGAKKVEGQLGQIEFELSAKQVAAIADLDKTARP